MHRNWQCDHGLTGPGRPGRVFCSLLGRGNGPFSSALLRSGEHIPLSRESESACRMVFVCVISLWTYIDKTPLGQLATSSRSSLGGSGRRISVISFWLPRASPRTMTVRLIGLTGTCGSGKGVVVDFLRQHGYQHLSVRALLSTIISERGQTLDRPTMIRVANELRREHSASYLVETLLAQAQATNLPCVIESVRNLAEVSALRRAGGILFAVDAPQSLRFSRVRARSSVTDFITFAEFDAMEKLESGNDDPTMQSLGRCVEAADALFVNDGSLEALRAKLQEVLTKH